MRTTWPGVPAFVLAVLMLLGSQGASARIKIDSTILDRFTYHFQLTTVAQYHPPFRSPYVGANSLQPHEGVQLSLTSTLFLGMKLWKGAELYFNPELAGGTGFSSTLGVGGFPNGETFRVGDPKPAVYVARGYFKQTFAFSKDYETIEDDENQVGTKVPKHFLSFTFGKVSMADFFDDNQFSHDPRKQFLNWSLMSNAAWDYPANTRGYTFALVAEYRYLDWSVRAATSLMPKEANGPDLDWNMSRSNSETVELERRYSIHGRKGVIRGLGFFTMAPMGNYAVATVMDTPDVTVSRKFSRTKAGFGINWEQEALPYLTFFMRGSWNDGMNETWAFTEVDNSYSAGLQLTGHKWRRRDDVFGAALVTNGISKDHQAYFAKGGYGFILGDGKLNYGREFIMEFYYSFKPFKKWLWISPDYQFILNPGYNKDRGPVHAVGLRLHVGI